MLTTTDQQRREIETERSERRDAAEANLREARRALKGRRFGDAVMFCGIAIKQSEARAVRLDAHHVATVALVALQRDMGGG